MSLTYEFPLLEKMRTLLRLEDLFARFSHFSGQDDPRDHHAALVALFDIVDICTRADLKLELVQELERQRQKMLVMQKNPQVDNDALSLALEDNQAAATALLSMVGKPGQHLRDNEWLLSIKNRLGVPGGTCEFDLPAYHFWLRSPSEKRKADLVLWMQPMCCLTHALTLVLRFIRGSGKVSHQTACQGAFQQMMIGRSLQLLRIELSENSPPCVPEVSANRYAINIRFISPYTAGRPVKVDTDIAFDLSLCEL